jgi:hypothetical protein
MSRKTTLVAAAGAASMIAGALGPWVAARSLVGEGSVPGTAYGGLAVIVLAVLVALLAAVDRPTLLGVCALTAMLWIGVVMYGAPGAVTSSWAYEAHITWGAYLALAGCLMAVGAAIARERATADQTASRSV